MFVSASLGLIVFGPSKCLIARSSCSAYCCESAEWYRPIAARCSSRLIRSASRK